MDTSLFLARLIGPMLLVIGLGVLINRENFRATAKELIASREQMFIIGLLTLLGGLAIVNTHNVWNGWPTIITVFGWIFVIGGAMRVLFPEVVRSIQSAALDQPMLPLIGGTVQALLGAWLCYAGFIA
jgi:cytochrome bd-type quinol oxidase subunit 2